MTASEDLGATASGGGGELSKLARPVDLEAQEAAGGHTLKEHVAKTVEYLKARDKQRASTFVDKAAAERWTNATLDANREQIARWLAGAGRKLDLDGPIDPAAGIIYSRATGGIVRPSFTRTVLLRSRNGEGFIVRTSFPETSWERS